MTTIKLHGSLGRELGETWKLKVRSLGEAIRAIEIQTKKFHSLLRKNDLLGIGYGIMYDDYKCNSAEELKTVFGRNVTIHIVPVIQGSDSKSWLYIAVGVVLIAASIFVPGLIGLTGSYASAFSSVTLSMGVALTFAGIARLLTPTPKLTEDSKNSSSSAFDGSINTFSQGLPVPLAYGTVLIGSQMISVATRSVDTAISE